MSEPFKTTAVEVRDYYVFAGMRQSLEEKDDLAAEFDRWLAQVKAEAWDACATEGHRLKVLFLRDRDELVACNPYRQEADQ